MTSVLLQHLRPVRWIARLEDYSYDPLSIFQWNKISRGFLLAHNKEQLLSYAWRRRLDSELWMTWLTIVGEAQLNRDFMHGSKASEVSSIKTETLANLLQIPWKIATFFKTNT